MSRPRKEQFDSVCEVLESANWADIKGYEGIYQISDSGQVMRMQTQVVELAATGEIIAERIKPSYLLKQSTNVNGYLCCGLTKGNKTQVVPVHRLVAQAFCEKQSEAQTEVHHINGMREDARAVNLIWVTPEDHQKLHETKPRVNKYSTYYKRTHKQ